VLDDLLRECRAAPEVTWSDGTVHDLRDACDVLQAWDRRDELDSIGAHIFREFAREVRGPRAEDPATLGDFWRVPFDPTDPITTPRGLRESGAAAALQALSRAVDRLASAGVPLGAKLGDVQYLVRNGQRIPVHGGLIYNRISLTLQAGGYTEPMGSADSYLQVVTFGAQGPIADTLLVHSQSTDPESPWYSDQTVMYSQKQWVHPPFTGAAIASAAIEPPLRLTFVRGER